MRESDNRRLVQHTLFRTRHARAFLQRSPLYQLLHNAPPGHGGFKFRPGLLHLRSVKCDFRVLLVGQFTQVPLVLVQRVDSRRLDPSARGHRHPGQHASPLFFEFPALVPQGRVFAAHRRQRLPLDVLLVLPDAQQGRVTFG